ncbi:MAG: 2-C-methyl-D-erythritol 4-phosphate cytidylyltransferase [Deltaproteobacteria bacterium]|nr:2-C-methyl-D-erythritol 4-phosphate cytidylyltransferase [Deltaproteobacteria bacterium]
MEAKNVALILAAGKGERMKGAREKAFTLVLGKPLLAWTLGVFGSYPHIHEVIVVVPRHREREVTEEILEPYALSGVRLVSGGIHRQDSMHNGFHTIAEPCNVVVIHDGARPLVEKEIIGRVMDAAQIHGASVAAVPLKDTVKVGDLRGMVRGTPDRNSLWAVQTPQGYQYSVIKEALAAATKDRFYGTDDASLVERIGKPVKIVTGSYENLKVTTPEDVVVAEAILRERVKGGDI